MNLGHRPSERCSFSAGYDDDGSLTSETYPNGLKAGYSYDPAGNATNLDYTKTTNCSSSCGWYSDSETPSVHDQTLARSSTLSAQAYTYDGAGRLTQVTDTPTALEPAASRVDYSIPTASAGASDITAGPDSASWFTEQSTNKIGRIAANGTTSEYGVPTAASKPNSISNGPDGALWFTENQASKIGRVTTSGTFTEYATPSNNAAPLDITSGSDGALWFVENGANKIGRVTTSGATTDYRIPTSNAGATGIAAGSDNALWFTENAKSKIGRVTTSGSVTEYTTPTASSGPSAIAAGSDGALWFTEASVNKIGRITTSGTITEYAIPTAASNPIGITTGPDDALWFTEASSGKIGRITTSGAITEYSLPTSSPGLAQIVGGTDSALWYVETTANAIGKAKAGTVCTVRKYGFDPDTNRSALTTIPHPQTSGACDTNSAHGTTQSYGYDGADRLTDSGVAYSTFGNITALPAGDAGGTQLTSSYYADNTLRSQTQAGLTVTYNLDPAGRTRETLDSGSITADLISHYQDGGDSPAWDVDQGSGAWTRYVIGIDGGLAAIERSSGSPKLEITNLHGDVVAEASADPSATALSSTNDSTEYGVPRSSTQPKYGWLGADQRSTDLPSGVIAMGARTYVPALGRFEQPDPVTGGSPNPYAYTGGDPVNQFDTSGAITLTLTGVTQYLSDGTVWTPDLPAQLQADYYNNIWLPAYDAQQAAAAAVAAAAANAANDGSVAAFISSMGCAPTSGCVPPPNWHPKKKKKKTKKKKHDPEFECDPPHWPIEAYRSPTATASKLCGDAPLVEPVNPWLPGAGATVPTRPMFPVPALGCDNPATDALMQRPLTWRVLSAAGYVLLPFAVVLGLRGQLALAVVVAALALTAAVTTNQWVPPRSQTAYRRRLTRVYRDWYGQVEHARVVGRRQARESLDDWLQQHPGHFSRPAVTRLRDRLTEPGQPSLERATASRLALRDVLSESGPDLDSSGISALGRAVGERMCQVVAYNLAETEAFVSRLESFEPPAACVTQHDALLVFARSYVEALRSFQRAYTVADGTEALESSAKRLAQAGERLADQARACGVGRMT